MPRIIQGSQTVYQPVGHCPTLAPQHAYAHRKCRHAVRARQGLIVEEPWAWTPGEDGPRFLRDPLVRTPIGLMEQCWVRVSWPSADRVRVNRAGASSVHLGKRVCPIRQAAHPSDPSGSLAPLPNPEWGALVPEAASASDAGRHRAAMASAEGQWGNRARGEQGWLCWHQCLPSSAS